MEDFEILVKNQESKGNAISNLYSNMKKDGPSRRNERYLTVRLTTLENHWMEAQKNDTKLKELEKVKEHNYVKNKYFEQIQEVYNKARKFIMDELNKIVQMNKEDENEQTHDAQGMRIKKQNVKIENLIKLINVIKLEVHDNKNKVRYESLLNKINHQWSAISELNEEIQINEENYQSEYFINDQFDKMEQESDDIIEKLENKIHSLNCRSEGSTHIPLPQIKVPQFAGTYEHWSTFSDLFKRIVHSNVTLSDAEKMQYLKTHVQGEAHRLIQHLKVTDGNYNTAWTQLVTRYDNKRLTISKLLNKILDFPKINNESAEKLMQLHDTTVECKEAISNLGVDTKSWGPLIGQIISKKWDKETNRLYEQSLDKPNEIQDFDELSAFLCKRFQSLEATGAKNESINEKPNRKCMYCEQNHSIYSCQKFIQLEVSKRIQVIKERKLCQKCLMHDESKTCNSKYNCKQCSKPHNTLLHKTFNKQNVSHKAENVQSTTLVGTQPNTVLLATALVRANDNYGSHELLRLLIDPGSQASFITEHAAQLLSLPRQKICAEIRGLGEEKPRTSTSSVNLLLTPRFSSDFNLKTTLLVLPKITRSLPANHLKSNTADQWKNQVLADPTFHIPGPIDILLGAQEYSNILLDGFVKTKDGLLGQKTEFGLIISGCASEITKPDLYVASMIGIIEEDKQLQKFWEMEEISTHRELTPMERECEEFYQNTITRNPDGRYVARFPFREPRCPLGTSRNRAVARLLQIENKFERQPKLKQQYHEFMKEYLKLRHMRLIPKSEEAKGQYYIPHQAVLKEDSTTTKIRVVFDASSKSSNGVSLNEVMHTGPRLQHELADILLRWRKHKVAFTADIEKMYRQIWIHPDDQQFQRILWRFDPKKPIQEYALTTVTYGTSSAPYLAVRTLQQLAADEAINYPNASQIAMRDFYVDDLLSGADSLDEAKGIQNELVQMCQRGGFLLRKWSSNEKKLLKSLPTELQDQSTLEIMDEGTKKSLGIHWAPGDDTFHFKNIQTEETKLTKRHILSLISRLYDPLGWLQPVVICAKLLIQEMWLRQLDWDQEVPDELQTQWTTFQKEMKYVEEINIPRWIKYDKQQTIELHGFCDASEKAYGAAVYSRVTCTDGTIHINLLMAKSKVASAQKKTTVPRLELCSAELLAKLIKRTLETLDVPTSLTYAWSDSMIALGWIRGNPQRWKTFVANRVSRIQALMNKDQWYHVRSEDNPADLISRGLESSKLIDNSLWWKGPAWLLQQDKWPVQKTLQESTEEVKCFKVSTQVQETNIINKFSSLTRMVRVIAYCIKFSNNCKLRIKTKNPLTVNELKNALQKIIKTVQRENYGNEMSRIQNSMVLEKKNKLTTLTPFIDKEGLLRVGGRLQNSLLTYGEKHPIILPYNNHLTRLIIEDAHHNTLHGGVQSTLALVRQKYWIINGKKLVAASIKNCVRCVRYKAQTAQQLMGNLPTARVIPSSPFSHTGIDYAGPIKIRTTKGRGNKSFKGYISIFVCFSTKAIHLEVVSDMTTESFLAAFQRFTSRRGQCTDIYSDNGTNFVGASKLLASVPEKLATSGINWHFIPPSAPHFGGLWEAGVKSMKHHLRRVIGDSTLTYEELTTLMHKIEACLNSRPLCTLADNDPENLVLTPGHFLIGRALLQQPNPVEADEYMSHVERWRMMEKMRKDFWKSWSSEYLGRLQQRYKWKTASDNVQLGRIVLIKDETINPSKWPLARVIAIHPADDNKVRVLTLQQSGGKQLKRPITKVIPLPVDDTSNNYEKNIQENPVAITSHLTTVRKTKIKTVSSPKLVAFWTIIVMLIIGISSVTTNSIPKYTVHYPPPGIYVEQIGHARIDRGRFRIQMQLAKPKIGEDANTVSEIVKQMEEFCTKVMITTNNATRCKSFVTHLQEQQHHLNSIQNGVQDVIQTRRKRGLLGNFLTSIFGVNEEVYHDINALQNNQNDIIKAANQQSRFMISALKTFNETEMRVMSYLNRFREKLNAGLESIDEMGQWYKISGSNHLQIQVLTSYQLASDYISELLDYYTTILNLHFHRNHLYEIVSPTYIANVIRNESRKLPSNIVILPSPLLETEVMNDKQFINIYGYFLMTEVSEFAIIKATPIPLKIENGSYWVYELSNDFLVINYDIQKYFQLTDQDFKTCILWNTQNYVCSPLAVRNLEQSPNCAINKIYEREVENCSIQKMPISTLIWKQTYIDNTWMFITPTYTKIAIICDGTREEVPINSTGIIQLSRNCIIQTKQNILVSKDNKEIKGIVSLIKPSSIKLNTTIKIHNYESIEKEPVLKVTDHLNKLRTNVEISEEEFQKMHWARTVHHSATTSIVTTLITLIALILLLGISYYGFRTFKWVHQVRNKQKAGSRSRSGDEMMMVPLNQPAPAKPQVTQEACAEPLYASPDVVVKDTPVQILQSKTRQND